MHNSLNTALKDTNCTENAFNYEETMNQRSTGHFENNQSNINNLKCIQDQLDNLNKVYKNNQQYLTPDFNNESKNEINSLHQFKNSSIANNKDQSLTELVSVNSVNPLILDNKETQASTYTDDKHTQITKEVHEISSQAHGFDTKAVQMLITHDMTTQAKYVNAID